ncbi:MAG: AAA family ATPase [Thermomicrobiales bacterium]|nr:AAA family ATPase [Thermomicrobiales bacterium]
MLSLLAKAERCTKWTARRLPAHDDGAFFIQYPSGATHYGCHHASCNGKGWQDVKHLLKLPKKPRLTVNGKEAGGSGKTAEPRAVGLKLRKASEIDPLEIEWLWRPWAPYGMLSLFAGYGGSGKSTVALAIAAAATTGGTLPDGKTAPLTNVLILAAEDSPEHTLIPRLIALGTDLDRVHIVDGVVRDNDEPGWIQLREHMPLIEATVRAENIGLVIIDPISSYIGDANGDKESDVRSALMPLVQMAETRSAASQSVTSRRVEIATEPRRGFSAPPPGTMFRVSRGCWQTLRKTTNPKRMKTAPATSSACSAWSRVISPPSPPPGGASNPQTARSGGCRSRHL